MKSPGGLNYLAALILAGCLLACNGQTATDQILTNGTIRVYLGINDRGVPYIGRVISEETNQPFLVDSSAGFALQERLETNFLREKAKLQAISGWMLSEDSVSLKAEAKIGINQAELSLHIELMKDSPLFRTYFTVRANSGTNISEFPVYSSSLALTDSSSLQWWKALEYTEQKELITSDTHLSLSSRIHSSDNLNGVSGNVPYWLIENKQNTVGFALAWCGGWRTTMNETDHRLTTDVYLPEEETQLNLKAGEEVKGPEMVVFCSEETNPMFFKNKWFAARTNLARKLYPAPDIQFPLIYNHWYAVEFNLSKEYISNQVRWFGDYGFDVFMIDAGWYKGVGSWTPDPRKFSPEAFSKSIETIQAGGALAGLWSCPQFVATGEKLPDFIDQPGRYNPFMNAWLIDYSAMDFSQFLTKHLDTLTNQLGAGWWKFDQDFFAEKPRAGNLKSVIALQNALAAARKNYPQLVIEACMSGGKMINELTDQISQTHWLRDGERTGYLHAVTNIYEALGAAEFLELQKVQRWTNRIDETEMETPDLLKFYCRSCMIGTWGISADLNKISRAQQTIILGEIRNYRRLNELKKDQLVEINYPGEYDNLIPVVFYDKAFRKAGIILYRMFPKNQEARVTVKTRLDPAFGYLIEDVDSGTKQMVSGNQFELNLKPGQNSGIYYVTENVSKSD